jgi:hypothetical protein
VIGQTFIDMCGRKPAWEGIGDDRERAFSEVGDLLELRCLKLRPNIIAALQGNRSYITQTNSYGKSLYYIKKTHFLGKQKTSRET